MAQTTYKPTGYTHPADQHIFDVMAEGPFVAALRAPVTTEEIEEEATRLWHALPADKRVNFRVQWVGLFEQARINLTT
jgi:hypothetical protein